MVEVRGLDLMEEGNEGKEYLGKGRKEWWRGGNREFLRNRGVAIRLERNGDW